MTYSINRHLITTEAKVRRCRCGTWVLWGLSEGVPVSCELLPVTPAWEEWAHSVGRPTFELYRGRLYRRERWGAYLPPAPVVLVAHAHTPVAGIGTLSAA